MKILAFVPASRTYALSIDSIFRLDWGEHDVMLVYEFGSDSSANRWENVTRKYQKARQMMLDGGYDALLTLEDDIIVPEDALLRLVDLEADIAYGLTVQRHGDHAWSAGKRSGPGDFHQPWTQTRSVWGTVIDVEGCGLFCTLIQRRVLETLDFELRGSRCCDFYLAVDAKAKGFSQKCDTRVQCGHLIDAHNIVYPAPDGHTRDGLPLAA